MISAIFHYFDLKGCHNVCGLFSLIVITLNVAELSVFSFWRVLWRDLKEARGFVCLSSNVTAEAQSPFVSKCDPGGTSRAPFAELRVLSVACQVSKSEIYLGARPFKAYM